MRTLDTTRNLKTQVKPKYQHEPNHSTAIYKASAVKMSSLHFLLLLKNALAYYNAVVVVVNVSVVKTYSATNSMARFYKKN
jgi:hypothetical protein